MRIPSRLVVAGLTVCLAAGLALPVHARSDARTEPAVADYRVGIEDVLRIFVYQERELSLTVRVRPDGKITVPLINDLHVAGLTTDEIRARITERLSEFITNPVVTVIVEEINSYRVYFLGEVRSQGARQFYSPTRLLQGLAIAGGLTEYSNKKIVLVRDTPAGETRTTIDYKKLLAGDESQDNLVLLPGDMLLFP